MGETGVPDDLRARLRRASWAPPTGCATGVFEPAVWGAQGLSLGSLPWSWGAMRPVQTMSTGTVLPVFTRFITTRVLNDFTLPDSKTVRA